MVLQDSHTWGEGRRASAKVGKKLFFPCLAWQKGGEFAEGPERLRDKGKRADSELRTVSAFCAKRQRGVNPTLAIWVMEVISCTALSIRRNTEARSRPYGVHAV